MALAWLAALQQGLCITLLVDIVPSQLVRGVGDAGPVSLANKALAYPLTNWMWVGWGVQEISCAGRLTA